MIRHSNGARAQVSVEVDPIDTLDRLALLVPGALRAESAKDCEQSLRSLCELELPGGDEYRELSGVVTDALYILASRPSGPSVVAQISAMKNLLSRDFEMGVQLLAELSKIPEYNPVLGVGLMHIFQGELATNTAQKDPGKVGASGNGFSLSHRFLSTVETLSVSDQINIAGKLISFESEPSSHPLAAYGIRILSSLQMSDDAKIQEKADRAMGAVVKQFRLHDLLVRSLAHPTTRNHKP